MDESAPLGEPKGIGDEKPLMCVHLRPANLSPTRASSKLGRPPQAGFPVWLNLGFLKPFRDDIDEQIQKRKTPVFLVGH